MALFSFGKKDKNPPEAAAPVAKATPTPPKIQTPPGSGTIPAVKPPQPSGLIPTSGMPASTATTQPMVMPRSGAAAPGQGLKPSRPGLAQSSRATQRIVLPAGTPGSRPNTTKPLSMTAPTGRINLPIGMILRCLPPEVLAADLSEFEASGAAATEIGLPINMILGQLPSGKVEMALQDLVPHFPAGYLQPTESIASYLPILISLPLMDVVMRIPPDLLSLRPDQKDVDAAVINMADPFTEEILREQAEAARRAAATQTNIIEESQAPQEEFVPRDQSAMSKTVAVPPPRPPSTSLPTPSRPSPVPAAGATPPMPPATRPSAPTPPPSVRSTAPIPPVSPSASSRTISASGRLAFPTRATATIPSRPQAAITSQLQPPPAMPSAAIPVPPASRQTASLPLPSRPAPIAPQAPISSVPPTPVPSPSTQRLPAPPTQPMPTQIAAQTRPPAPAVTEAPAAAPDTGSDDLQRLAALAMQQLGDSTTDSGSTAISAPPATSFQTEPILSSTVPVPAPVIAAEPEPEPEPFIQPPPAVIEAPKPVVAPRAPESAPASIVAAPRTAEPAPAPVAAAKPEPEAQPASAASGVAFNLNTCTADDLVQNIPGCFRDLAESIVAHRNKIGSFKRLEDLLDVPGITKAAYTNLTGETPPDNRIPLSLNELLGYPVEQHISLKDVTDRIACWPDVTGCILSQSSGLSLVGTAPEGLDKAAIVAFAPRMFDALNKSFSEITGNETDALILPTPGNSFHIFRNKDLYLIILSRLPQMPERHMKVARFVLSALSIRRD